jgi:hypothetical protein
MIEPFELSKRKFPHVWKRASDFEKALAQADVDVFAPRARKVGGKRAMSRAKEIQIDGVVFATGGGSFAYRAKGSLFDIGEEIAADDPDFQGTIWDEGFTFSYRISKEIRRYWLAWVVSE